MKNNIKVAICIEVKNENRYIREWLEYHKNLGFDNIILYDNNDSNGENIYDVIGNDIETGFVIYENIKDKTNYQLPCYNECLEKYYNDFDWILFLDCDEFLILNNYENVHCWLSLDKFNAFEQILINVENYGDSNLVFDDGGTVLNRFKIKKERNFQDSCLFTKPCLNTSKYTPEIFIFKDNPNCIYLYNTTCDINGNKIFPCRILFTSNNDCVIRHFMTKTIEEYLIRHKYNYLYDTNIQAIAKKLKIFFEINNTEYKLAEKLQIIHKYFPWYRHTYNNCDPIDIVIIDDNNPLLQYTIKSIRKNLSWINNIYIVSRTNIKIDGTITVLFSDIIPEEFINSNIDKALFLHNIEKLSERFIYVYSGTIFNYVCFEDEFFRNNKVCMSPLNFKDIPKRCKITCLNNCEFFLNRPDITNLKTYRINHSNMGYMFSRTCCPMLKSNNEACFNYLKDDIFTNLGLNHLIYPMWYRLMYNTFDYIHTNVLINEVENPILEIEDPIYKIINIPFTECNDKILYILNKRFEK